VARQLGTVRRRRRTAGQRIVHSRERSTICKAVCSSISARRVVVHHGEKRGKIEIEYYGNDDLERVLGLIGPAGNDS
jgi:hypothetical protein